MKRMIGVITIILLTYSALHSTPSLAVRTALFLRDIKCCVFWWGDERKRCEKEAIPDEYQTLYGKEENSEHYFFPHVRAHESGIDMLSACVKKNGFSIKQSSGVIKYRRMNDVSI